MKTKSKKISLHVFVLLFILVLAASLMTYVIPGGEFERVKNEATGETIVIADSYKEVDSQPVEPWTLPHKFYEALSASKTAGLIFFIFIIGGSFEVVMHTGSLTALCERLLYCFRNKRRWIIPIFVSLFSVFGFTMGLSTASVIFVPIGIAAAAMLGFDRLTGVAMVALGTNAGFAAGIFNPFSVGVAQTLAEVPLYSGAWIRVLLLIVLVPATSLYLMRFADKRGQLDPEAQENTITPSSCKAEPLTSRQKLVLIEFVILFSILIIGVSALHFKTADIAVTFLIMGFLVGLTAGFGLNQTCETFIAGCRKMVKGSLVIGLAATMRQVLADGMILDTITRSLTGLVYYFPKWAQLTGMYLSNAGIDLVITSGSAHAAVVMPIMTPMADFLGLTRQSAVLAFQLGDGLVNLTSPISTTLTGILAVSELSYDKWIRFFLPLVGIYLVIGACFMILAGAVGY